MPRITDDPSITPALIRSTRKRARLTQAEFGALVGYSRHAVMNWEQGRFLPPSDLPERMAKANLASLPAKPDKNALTDDRVFEHYRQWREGTGTHAQYIAMLQDTETGKNVWNYILAHPELQQRLIAAYPDISASKGPNQ